MNIYSRQACRKIILIFAIVCAASIKSLLHSKSFIRGSVIPIRLPEALKSQSSIESSIAKSGNNTNTLFSTQLDALPIQIDIITNKIQTIDEIFTSYGQAEWEKVRKKESFRKKVPTHPHTKSAHMHTHTPVSPCPSSQWRSAPSLS
jgi:hypothetical protein